MPKEEKLLSINEYAKKHKLSRQWIGKNINNLMRANGEKSIFTRDQIVVVKITKFKIKDE